MTATASFSPATCHRCGRSLPADAPAGLCPQCLLSDGFGDRSEPTFRYSADRGPRFVPPTIEELESEFPQLEFVRLLGSGGMGAVYLANQVRLARPVAVKILPPDLADDVTFSERFLREARALARLSHPNIVGVFDFGQTPGGLYYFLMEYIEGPTLRQVVANRSADPKQALEIVRQVCDALQYAHDKGVVHRDIKPENVLLDSQGRVKIADFGLAKLLGIADTAPGSPAAGSLTGTRQAMGTPHYMAPEQIMGSRSVDHRADIYSLGVVFYELLTGELPLGRFAPPSRKVQVDVRLDDVVLRTLEAEPEQRYQRARDVKTDVETISFVPPSAAAPGPATRLDADDARHEHVERRAFNDATMGRVPRNVKIAWGFALVAVVCVMLVVAFGAIGGDEAAAICAAIVMWFGLPGAVCASVLAVSAIGEIRRSDGRVTGLVAAVAVALAIPLLLLDGFVWFVSLLPGFLFAENILRTGNDDPALLIATLIAVPAALLVDFCLLRQMWRWATRGLSRERIERELSVIPVELQETGAKVANFLDKALQALKPIQRRHEWQAERPIVPRPVARYVPPAAASPSPSDMPVLRPVEEPLASPPGRNDARLSRKAVIGVAWIASIPLAGAFFLIAAMNQRNDAIELPLMAIGALCAVPAAAAPFVTTILGWLAVGDIRRSRGNIVGLPLAVFDGLFFPLFLLDWVLFALSVGLALALTRAGLQISPGLGPDGNISVLAIPISLVACVLLDLMIVKAVWRRVRPQSPIHDHAAPADSAWNGSQHDDISFLRRHRELFAAGVAIGVAAILLLWKVSHDWDMQQEQAHVAPTAPAAPMPYLPPAATDGQVAASVEEMQRHWRFGTNGPEIVPQWGSGVGLNPEQQEKINAVLQRVYSDYERTLEEHMTVARRLDGATFTIEAFPQELESLMNRFWSEVDPLLTRDQQAMMRYNFPLRFDQRRNVYSSDDIDKTVLLFGAERAIVSIERTGQWFRWSVSGPIGFGRTTPELPHALFGWERRLDRVLALAQQSLPMPFRSIPVAAEKPAEQ